MSRHKGSIEVWRDAVFKSTRVSDHTKVLLLLLADYMGPDLKVCVPRSTLAKRLGKSERRISERLREATARDQPPGQRSHRLLDPVVRGQKHVTAVYQGLLPDALSGTSTSTLRSAETRTLRFQGSRLNPILSGHPVRPTYIEADLLVSPTDRDVGIDEKTEDQPARSDLLVCDCHGASDCASLDRPHTREESA
jgi:hypothetical protein